MDYSKKNMEKCSAQPSAECFVSSFRQEDNTKSRNQKDLGGKDIQDDEMSEKTQEEDNTNDEFDQDRKSFIRGRYREHIKSRR